MPVFFMQVLFITPPLVQTHSPYPATPVLMGALRKHWLAAGSKRTIAQVDLSLEFFLQIFSKRTLTSLAQDASKRVRSKLLAAAEVIDPVMEFLQQRSISGSTLAWRIVSRTWLPEGPRFKALQQDPANELLFHHFGTLGLTDQARHLASLFLNDVADILHRHVDPRFEYSRYGEKLAASMTSFDPLAKALTQSSALSKTIEDLAQKACLDHRPDVVAITIPFPGNLLGALIIARSIKHHSPHTQVVLGGGTPNTEWRSLEDPRLFDCVDFVCLDDGVRPLLNVLDHISGLRPRSELKRTYVRSGARVEWIDASRDHDIPFGEMGTPDYEGLPLDRYVGVFEMLNPVQRLWTDFRWLKLTLARGCYWKKCSFCDTSLPYIKDYSPDHASALVDKMEAMMKQTGWTGFHFVDEAAPPALLKALSLEILKRKLTLTWWGNIRFEKAFTSESVELMARSGCIALTGGLEVASDRLLKKMQKGVTVAQVAQTTRAMTEAGILVHAYLMYGFPTQTTQETIDSLELVRQLFDEGCIQSGFWHRLSVTAHSPMGQNPDAYGVKLLPMKPPRGSRKSAPLFAQNDLAFKELRRPAPHDRLGEGLRSAIYHYKLGIGLKDDVGRWFGFRTPPTRISKTAIRQALHNSLQRTAI